MFVLCMDPKREQKDITTVKTGSALIKEGGVYRHGQWRDLVKVQIVRTCTEFCFDLQCTTMTQQH